MESWSTATTALWGKFDPGTGASMPLARHLTDSADVAGALWDQWLSAGARVRFAELFGGAGRARAAVRFLAGIHDIGKAAPDFQRKIEGALAADGRPAGAEIVNSLRGLGYAFPLKMGRRLEPHGLLGQLAVEELLGASGVDAGTCSSVAGVVGAHHGRPVASPFRRPTGMGSGLWSAAREELWHGIATHVGFEPHELFTKPLPPWAQVQLNGLVVMADWMASNVDLFPLVADQTDRLGEAIDRLDLPDPWRPRCDADDASRMLAEQFPELASFDPTPLQREAVQAARSLEAPSLMILEAPMGDGKTEAALMVASVMAERFGQRGVFFALPTMATSNPMFGRVRSWLQAASTQGRTTLNLVHGKAALNDDYTDLVTGRVASVHEATDGDEEQPEVYVASWFTGRRRSVLADHVVGTIDQVLFAALRAKHVMLRQLALAGKVVVIDEVHATDDFMRTYLERTLTWLGDHQVPVVLLSATLPPRIRSDLAGAYVKGVREQGRVESLPDSEPRGTRITIAGAKVRDWPVEQPKRQRTVEIIALDDDPAALVQLVERELVHPGCVGIICDTVSRAQERYLALREVEGLEVQLVHSKFVAPHRASREADLVRKLGRTGDRPQRLVVVGTQVLEQSLDIDFDALVSDLAPIDLLLQRMGRLHRHERPRPERLARPRVYLTGISGWKEVPLFAAGLESVYGRWRLLSALAVLGDLPASIQLPGDIPDLVAEGCDEERACPPGWEDAWQTALKTLRQHRDRQCINAEAFCVSAPGRRWDLVAWEEPASRDPESPRVAGRAAVRDSEECLEVIVLQGDGAGNACLLPGIGELSGRVVPRQLSARDNDLAKAAASCTVALPAVFTHQPAVLDAVIAELESYDASGWQNSPWLAGRLVLELDARGGATINGVGLQYDQELGLRVTQAP